MLCKSILLVEDDNDIRETVEEVLKLEGYPVHAVCNGREAIRVLKKMPAPTLILLDMMMPLMNGWEFAEAWQKEIPADHSCIVVVSALDAQKALTRGPRLVPAQGYIHKPIDLDTLIDTVRLHCGLPGEAKAAVEAEIEAEKEAPIAASF